MPSSVKVCAIAKDEGPYLADWVFHHLHFGADAVEVWVNGTEDTSMAVLERIRAAYPQVSFRDADDLREECRRAGTFFQYDAYARMAAEAEQEGFTHAAFLDLDEYWVPRDLATPLPAFLPGRRAVNVVSFPWCVDVPDAARAPFENPFAAPLRVQLDHHVKSVVRLDGRVRQIRPHTARTRSGRRLLVRDPFPLEDERAQQWGSFVTWEALVGAWDTVPEAFVLHAKHRSQVEYVASLRRTGQLPTDAPDYRTNRDGFGARARPVLDPGLPEERVAAYHAARLSFLARVDAEEEIAAARASASLRADLVVADATGDPALADRLRPALRGVVDDRLARRLPEGDYRLEWHVDGRDVDAGRVAVWGWAFSDVLNRPLELGARDTSGKVRPASTVAWSARPDVPAQLLGAPVECGFRAVFDGLLDPATTDPATIHLVLRPVGATAWQVAPSSALAPRPA